MEDPAESPQTPLRPGIKRQQASGNPQENSPESRQNAPAEASQPGQLTTFQRCQQYSALYKQRFLNCVVEYCFPKTADINPNPTLSTKTELSSSLPLQIILYYNMLYSCVWFFLFAACWGYKNSRAKKGDLWTGYMFICASVIEAIRLWMGYDGNLNEKVADVSGFFILCWVKIGFSLFFITGQYLALPLDSAINILMVFFDLAGIVFGYLATKTLIRSQSTRFYMNQLWTDDPNNPNSPSKPSPNRPNEDHLL